MLQERTIKSLGTGENQSQCYTKLAQERNQLQNYSRFASTTKAGISCWYIMATKAGRYKFCQCLPDDIRQLAF